LFLRAKTGQWTLSAKIAVNLPAADFEGEFLALTLDGQTTLKDRIWGDDYDTEFLPALMATNVETESKPTGIDRLKNDVPILGRKAITLIKKQLRDYFPAILPIPFAMLAIIGFFRKPWTRERAAKELFLISFVLSTIVGYAVSAVELRYLFPIIPMLMAWAAHGLVEFSQWLADTARDFVPERHVGAGRVTAGVMLIMLAISAPVFFYVLKPDSIANVPFEEKDAGLWIKDHKGSAQITLMSANITPAFYAGAKHLYLPDEDLETTLEYAKSRKVNYLVFSERRDKDSPLLLESADLQHEARLVYHDLKYTDHEILVFELNQ
jgi:hypothetical protein